MGRPKNAMEIFQALDQSNCRECGQKTCLAFAGAVFMGRKRLTECPKLDPDTIVKLSWEDGSSSAAKRDGEQALKNLVGQISGVDLAAAARRIGARFSGNRLTLKMLGKNVGIDAKGNIFTDIHVNPWMAMPFLTYILHGKGVAVSGNWVSFRELKGGQARYPLFRKRCEAVIKRLADGYPGLFRDIVDIFNGRRVAEQFEADISVVLDPLPGVPVMICYWMPEEGMTSSVNVFFDETADRNIGVDAVFTLGTGLAQMFEKLALRHGFSDLTRKG